MRVRFCLTILFLLAFAAFSGVSAAVCRVTKTADTNDGQCDADCSLREAVASASCGTVIFPGQLFHQFGTTIVLSSGELRIDHPISIIGTGADRLTISGNNASRVFYVNAPASISGLTLTGGNAGGADIGMGGAIYSSAGNSLTLDAVHVTGNSATFPNPDGGGVHMLTGSHTIRNSTFSANTGGFGSAIRVQGGSLTIVNSTIANNPSALGFGALSVFHATVTVRNCTFRGNSPGASILLEFFASLTFGNSIIETIANDACNSSGFGMSAGNNLISAQGFCSFVQYHSSDIFNPNAPLNLLQNNGGTTPTMELPAGSPAIDSGNNQLALDLPITFDQRGVRRIFDGNFDGTARIDIGAVETGQSLPPQGAIVKGRVFTADGRPVRGAIVSIITEELDFTRTGVTNPFGYYLFYTPAGRYCTITVRAKRGVFTPIVVMSYPYQENINFYPQ